MQTEQITPNAGAATQAQHIYPQIDALLEAMWQKSAERAGKMPGRRDYNYARCMFIRAHRAEIENAAYRI